MGVKDALEVKQLALKARAARVAILSIPEQIDKKGWDAYDARADGWTMEEANSLLRGLKFSERDSFIPTEFKLNKEGVWYNPDTDNGEKPLIWICSRLEVIAETRDENGENWGRLLRWHDRDGRKHERAFPMSLFKGDGADLREHLLHCGLEISSTRRQKLSEYIQRVKPARKATSISRTGWHDGFFALPDEIIPHGEDMFLQNGFLAYHAFKQAGVLADWQQHVGRYVVGNSRLMLAICAAFAAPLMRLSGAESGGFHLRGGSSIGKSTALYVAASVWGGDKKEEYVQQWRSTANALEATAEAHNDCLLCLDEMGQIDGREAGEVAYMLANEAGKNRMSKDADLKKRRTWKLLFLSTGEVSLQEKMLEAGKRSHAGMETRLVDIPADAGVGLGVFESLHDFKSAETLSRHLKANAKQYYGTPIRAFLAALIQHNAVATGEWVRASSAHFIERCAPDDADGQVKRVCGRFGLVAAAGRLASEYGVLPVSPEEIERGIEACFQSWLGQRGTHGDLETLRGIQQVKQFFMQHGSSRFGLMKSQFDSGDEEYNLDDNAMIRDRAGYKRKNREGYWQYLVYPATFREVLCKGHDSAKLSLALIREGLLLPDKKTECPYQTVKLPKPDAKTGRMYVFSSGVLQDEI